jgi:hypothetical protein
MTGFETRGVTKNGRDDSHAEQKKKIGLFQGVDAAQIRKGKTRASLNGRRREERERRVRTTSRRYETVEERESEEGNKPNLKRKGEKPTSKTEWARKRRKSTAKADNLPRI